MPENPWDNQDWANRARQLSTYEDRQREAAKRAGNQSTNTKTETSGSGYSGGIYREPRPLTSREVVGVFGVLLIGLTIFAVVRPDIFFGTFLPGLADTLLTILGQLIDLASLIIMSPLALCNWIVLQHPFFDVEPWLGILRFVFKLVLVGVVGFFAVGIIGSITDKFKQKK